MSDEELETPVVGSAPPHARTLMSNAVYDSLKFLVVVVLPATGALYFGLASIWGLPKAEEVVGSIVVLTTFLGVVLQISNKSYTNSDERFDGDVNIDSFPEEGYSELKFSLDPKAIEVKDEIVVRVNRKS